MYFSLRQLKCAIIFLYAHFFFRLLILIIFIKNNNKKKLIQGRSIIFIICLFNNY